MMLRQWANVLLIFTVACSAASPSPTTEVTPEPTPTLPPPAVQVTLPPEPDDAARVYLDALKADDFSSMYAGLAGASQAAITEEDFTARYWDALVTAAVGQGELDYEILSIAKEVTTAVVNYRTVWHSVLVGDIEREIAMNLVLEAGQWRILWDEALVLPDLVGGNVLRMVNYVPGRGEIYDQHGDVLATYADVYALGIVPAQINLDHEENMLRNLSSVTGFPWEYIYSLYRDYSLEDDLYIPFTDVPAEVLDPVFDSIAYDAVVIQPFSGRYYAHAGVAPQTVGYVSAIQPQEVDAYRRRGYNWAERVARDGVELWAEQYLGGTRGGALYVDGPAGVEIELLAERDAEPAHTVYTTLDRDVQIWAQEAIFGFKGAVVVLERDTGRILAMASAPLYNPNLFEPTNPNAAWVSPLSDSLRPLVNRATQGQYPLGSVFKIITIAAALESGLYTPESTYDCQHAFTELGDPILYDWTYWDELDPSGLLTLPEGLMRSCNPWFWHIGLDLFNQGLTTAVADMARDFGLGSPTNPEQLFEQSGVVLDPGSPLEATNLAIGQGDLLVSPLQVAAFVAAVGNGGTLYRPQIIERVESPDGEVVLAFEPQVNDVLPVSPENLETIRDAMVQVVRHPDGTAYRVLGAFPIRIAGKTGTAESGQIKPHSWFVAYSDEGRVDKPDIAVVAIVENIGEGVDYAAPIVRRVLDMYFFGEPRNLNKWEIRPGVPRSLVEEEEEETPADEGATNDAGSEDGDDGG